MNKSVSSFYSNKPSSSISPTVSQHSLLDHTRHADTHDNFFGEGVFCGRQIINFGAVAYVTYYAYRFEL